MGRMHCQGGCPTHLYKWAGSRSTSLLAPRRDVKRWTLVDDGHRSTQRPVRPESHQGNSGASSRKVMALCEVGIFEPRAAHGAHLVRIGLRTQASLVGLGFVAKKSATARGRPQRRQRGTPRRSGVRGAASLLGSRPPIHCVKVRFESALLQLP